MKIIIAGAGSVGYHLAKLLSRENQDITIIDSDDDVLDYVRDKLDVMTISGNATSLNVMEEAEVKEADLFIAVTTSEDTNMLTALLAKQKGAKKTIARVANNEFLSSKQKEYFSKIGIDTLISPANLAALEIKRLIKRASLTDSYDFEEGRLSIVGFSIDALSNLIGKTVAQINQGNHEFNYRGVAILRDHQTIIPRGSTRLYKGDHLYLSLKTKDIDKAMPFLGKQSRKIKNVMIIGDTPLTLRTAELLQDIYNVSVLMPNKEVGKKFLKTLNNCLVSIGDPSNKEFLEQEGIERMDAFVALTPNSEINILTSLLAEESGVYKTIALVDNDVYTHISQNIGVDTIINKKIIAANNIFRFVRKGKVEAIATLHGVDAEIIEFKITHSGRLTELTLGELSLPHTCIVAGVVRGHHTIIPGGDFVMDQGDKVIIFVLPEAISAVEEIFQ